MLDHASAHQPLRVASQNASAQLLLRVQPDFQRSAQRNPRSFRKVIPRQREDYPRVTHPCATVPGPKPFLVRLACVKRAASVDSEPGSNSRLNRLVSQDSLKTASLRSRLSFTKPRAYRCVRSLQFNSGILTNFFLVRTVRLSPHDCYIASNQIVKDLRTQNQRSVKKIGPDAGLESRFGASSTYI